MTPVLQVSLDGGAWASGNIVATSGQVVGLKLASTSGVTSARWEIYEFPEDWVSVPSGWSRDSNGVTLYALTDGSPPTSFTLPAYWGKFLLRVTVNGVAWKDESTGISILSSGGLEDVAYLEGNQFDSKRGWVGALKRDLRTLATGGGFTAAGDLSGNGTSQTVIGINGASISGTLEDGDALFYYSPNWLPLNWAAIYTRFPIFGGPPTSVPVATPVEGGGSIPTHLQGGHLRPVLNAPKSSHGTTRRWWLDVVTSGASAAANYWLSGLTGTSTPGGTPTANCVLAPHSTHPRMWSAEIDLNDQNDDNVLDGAPYLLSAAAVYGTQTAYGLQLTMGYGTAETWNTTDANVIHEWSLREFPGTTSVAATGTGGTNAMTLSGYAGFGAQKYISGPRNLGNALLLSSENAQSAYAECASSLGSYSAWTLEAFVSYGTSDAGVPLVIELSDADVDQVPDSNCVAMVLSSSAINVYFKSSDAWFEPAALISHDFGGSINGNADWHHVMVTYSGTTVTLYLDGVSAGTSTQTLDTLHTKIRVSAPQTPIGSGTQPPSWSAYQDGCWGYVRNVRFSNVARDATYAIARLAAFRGQ